MKKKLINLISLLLLISMVSGCGSSSNDDSVEYTEVTGKAIDGYIKSANVVIRNKATNKVLSTVVTDENGSFVFDKPSGVDIIVEISGGIDTSTGEKFSGVMKNVISKDTNGTNLNVTPLTTLVAELAISGEESIISARTTISESMNLDLDMLDADPIALLKDGNSTQKEHASKIMKNILTIQKFAQVISSVADDENSTYENVFTVISKKLKDGKDSNLTFDTILDVNHTSEVINAIKDKSSIQQEKDKFDSIKEVAKDVVVMINEINTTKLAIVSDNTKMDDAIALEASAVEVLIISLDDKLEEIHQATNATEITTAKNTAEDVVKAEIELGGINGITNTIGNKDNNTTVSDFTDSFLTDDKIKEESQKYDNEKNSGKTTQQIIEENKDHNETVVIKSFGRLKGSLYKEITNDTIRSGSEQGIANVSITIQDSVGLKEIVSDANGYFTFDKLADGNITITIDMADTDMPEGANGTHIFTKTITSNNTVDMGDIAFTFGDTNSIDPSDIATCQNPISFTWDGSTVDGSSKTVWEDIKNNNNKEVVIGGYTVTLTYSDINGQFNNADSGTADEDNSSISKGVFGSPYLTLYMGDDNDKNTSSGSLAKGDMVKLRVDFNESVVLDNWLFRDIDSGDIRNGESGWDWQDAVKIKAYDAQHNPVEMSINLSETTNLQVVNGVVRTKDTITTGAGTDTTDPKGHARWSSNGQAIKYMIVEYSSGPAISHPTRTAIAASGFSFCAVSKTTAPTLSVVPTTTTENSIDVELNGLAGAKIYINGVDTNLTIDAQGSKTISLKTEGGEGTKTFKIELVNDGVKSNALEISIEKTISAVKPTRADAIKFLRQAAFRMSEDEISYVINNGYEAWIDNQFSMVGDLDDNNDTKYGYLESTFRILNQIDSDKYPEEIFTDPTLLPETPLDLKRAKVFRGSVFWDKALNDENQLRQRLAYALSQIVVTSDVSPAGQAPRFRGEALATYFDILYKHSFGNYRDLLTDVTKSSMMGYFMTYLGSDKAAPDENYARELTQLFTVGLYELNEDGTLVDGVHTPSFDQQHVTDLARVFTGWSLDDKQEKNGKHPRFGSTAKADNSWVSSLVFNADHHDTNSTLDLIGSETMTTSSDGDIDIKNALDILFANHNVAPHISRHLIMRFVTSNPTPEYVGRVAAVFNDNGSGVKGDLKAVIKAILLDDEARGKTQPINFGKVDEMLVAFPHLLSAFNSKPIPSVNFGSKKAPNIVNNIFWLNPDLSFEQSLLGSDTVFNFYSNEFVPSDPYFADNKLVSPELQIQNTPNIIGFNNLFKNLLQGKEKYTQVNIGNYDTMEKWAEDRAFGQYTMTVGLLYLDLSDEYEVFEKALDNEDVANGDFANMGETGTNEEDRKRAIEVLCDFVYNKLIGTNMPDSYKTELVEHFESLSYPKSDAGRKNRATTIVPTVVQAVATSPLFMVIK